jgi:hypothetical protein
MSYHIYSRFRSQTQLQVTTCFFTRRPTWSSTKPFMSKLWLRRAGTQLGRGMCFQFACFHAIGLSSCLHANLLSKTDTNSHSRNRWPLLRTGFLFLACILELKHIQTPFSKNVLSIDEKRRTCQTTLIRHVSHAKKSRRANAHQFLHTTFVNPMRSDI